MPNINAHLYPQIQASLSEPTSGKAPDLRNIADLTHSLVSNSPAVPTLQLYMRIAFLVSFRLVCFHVLHCDCNAQRWHLATYPDVDYWTKVDETLARWRKSRTAVQITE